MLFALPLQERQRLAEKILNGEPNLLTGTGTVLIRTKTGLELLRNVRNTNDRLRARNRQPGQERLRRGRIVYEAETRKNIGWKRMPKYILDKYPDWFPNLTPKQRQSFGERLRKMARDAEKHFNLPNDRRGLAS
jgi:hypothetical protein